MLNSGNSSASRGILGRILTSNKFNVRQSLLRQSTLGVSERETQQRHLNPIRRRTKSHSTPFAPLLSVSPAARIPLSEDVSRTTLDYQGDASQSPRNVSCALAAIHLGHRTSSLLRHTATRSKNSAQCFIEILERNKILRVRKRKKMVQSSFPPHLAENCSSN